MPISGLSLSSIGEMRDDRAFFAKLAEALWADSVDASSTSLNIQLPFWTPEPVAVEDAYDADDSVDWDARAAIPQRKFRTYKLAAKKIGPRPPIVRIDPFQ
ncbi:hypothetical protein [Roseimicrobium sp. ORNL1]|uniref:hypothetical protein n=1 Tax=Roseimicrobium sp. ORNL1 TaxID=2711231 RepID=UPI0013E1D0B0|nr:hypothetical protein [Roseimicrobium sp. ORNL1]QIF04644.1 hypothetical protein G5S37_24980 [Roseimicrobium sp. ORNL1]